VANLDQKPETNKSSEFAETWNKQPSPSPPSASIPITPGQRYARAPSHLALTPHVQMATVPCHLGCHTNALLLCALCSAVELLMMQQLLAIGHLPLTPASSLHSRRLTNKEYLSEQATNICAKKCFKFSFRRYSGLYIIRSPLPYEFWNGLG
jgi:hypothetical protein